MIEVRPVSCGAILEASNASELLAEYDAECSLPELGSTSPQRHLYEAMEKSGGMQAFGVYEYGVLIGFATALVWTVPHYGKLVASTESIFIASKNRSAAGAAKLLNALESYAKERGCYALLVSAPAGSRFERLLSLGVFRYRRSNAVFLRKLA